VDIMLIPTPLALAAWLSDRRSVLAGGAGIDTKAVSW